MNEEVNMDASAEGSELVESDEAVEITWDEADRLFGEGK